MAFHNEESRRGGPPRGVGRTGPGPPICPPAWAAWNRESHESTRMERERFLNFERGASASELGKPRRSRNWHGRRQFWILNDEKRSNTPICCAIWPSRAPIRRGAPTHLRADGTRQRLSVRSDGLAQPEGARLGAVQHDGRGPLHGGFGTGVGIDRSRAGDLQHRPGQPVHQRRMDRSARRPWREDQCPVLVFQYFIQNPMTARVRQRLGGIRHVRDIAA